MVKQLILLLLLCSISPARMTGQTVHSGYQLVWSDEFTTDGLPDSTRWSYDLGDGCPLVCNWGNNERQYYTQRPENAHVSTGHLRITARKESMAGYAYTSARMVTKNKGDVRYGRLDIRARLPKGKGTWPAIWMLPTRNIYGGWPASGEIDIMEHVGYEPDSIFGTVHTEAFNHIRGTQKSGAIMLKDAEQSFHEYSVEWDESHIRFLIDNTEFFRFSNNGQGFASWPFDQPFHLILNLAVGGNWGGKHGIDDIIWPQTMDVDYVRIYQKEK